MTRWVPIIGVVVAAIVASVAMSWKPSRNVGGGCARLGSAFFVAEGPHLFTFRSGHAAAKRRLPNPSQWQVTPETARLLQHWRQHQFSGVRPFFSQVGAAETAVWLTEVAPQSTRGKRLLVISQQPIKTPIRN